MTVISSDTIVNIEKVTSSFSKMLKESEKKVSNAILNSAFTPGARSTEHNFCRIKV